LTGDDLIAHDKDVAALEGRRSSCEERSYPDENG
jgi:hypothetical protein